MAATSLENVEKSRHLAVRTKLCAAIALAGWPAVADKIMDCQTMGRRGECLGCGHVFVRGDSCRHRLCPECGRSRAINLYNIHKKLTGKSHLKHLILTVESVYDIKGKTKWLRSCFNRLRHRKIFKQSWRGGVYAIEYTYDKNKGWHIHIHALIDGDYIPQPYIAKCWSQITGGKGRIVWIKRAVNSKETLKYILKPSNDLLDESRALGDFLSETEGSHLVSGFGCYYRVTEKKLNGKIKCPNCGCDNIQWSFSYTLTTWDIRGSPC